METKWNDLTLTEKLVLIKHNEGLEKYKIQDTYFAINAFVRCKNNGIIRYVSDKNDSERFKDNGQISGCKPSTSCFYENYIMI